MRLLNLTHRKNAAAEFAAMQKQLRRRYRLYSARIACPCTRGLISVVLPVYNGAAYLRESICSVQAQTYTNWELIVVDDGSRDGSGALAEELAGRDPRIRVIHQENQKLPKALNRGFAAASGEYLTWTSADNRMMPYCLETLASELERDPAADMVFGNMSLIDHLGRVLRGWGWYEIPPASGRVMLPASTRELNIYPNNTIGAAFLYRAGVNAVLSGYSPCQYTLEDYDFFMRLNSLFNVKHCGEKRPLYAYRIHKDSLTSRDKELGITAGRPALMALDRVRRSFYPQSLHYWVNGAAPALEGALRRLGRVVTDPAEAAALAAEKPARIAYIYIHGTGQDGSWRPPRGIPRVYTAPEPVSAPGDFDLYITGKDQVLPALGGSRGWYGASCAAEAAALLDLRAKNDLLHEYERLAAKKS